MRTYNFVGLLVITLLIFSLFSTSCDALSGSSTNFVTLVFPVRSRHLWSDDSIDNLRQFIALTDNLQLSATYLLQYDVLDDKEVVETLKSTKTPIEIGILVEVSEKLASDAFVPYIIGSGDWARPDKAFLSGYTPIERKRLIDRYVRKFTNTFGSPPQAIGAWHIDPVSMAYFTNRYHIEASLIVADQYSTDRYESWGKYFGAPYYPSKFNTLIPAQSIENKLDVVTLQWAHRDLVFSYGLDVDASTFSLQANDYQGHHQLTTNYFKDLFTTYLQPSNIFNQITVGLEVGQEQRFFSELANEITYIKDQEEKNELLVVTMSEFAHWYKQRFFTISPAQFYYTGDGSKERPFSLWYMSPYYRVNLYLENHTLSIRDLRVYDEEYIDQDLIFADRRTSLFRTVRADIDSLVLKNPKILSSSVSAVDVDVSNDKVSVIFKEGDNRSITIDLSERKLFSTDWVFNAKSDAEKRRSLRRPSFFSLYQNIEFLLSDLPAILITNLDGRQFVGVSIGKEEFLGFQLKPVRFVYQSFPFQTLSRFRRFPHISLKSWFESDASREAKNKLAETPALTIMPRENAPLSEITRLEALGWKRVLENSEYILWSK